MASSTNGFNLATGANFAADPILAMGRTLAGSPNITSSLGHANIFKYLSSGNILNISKYSTWWFKIRFFACRANMF